MKEIRYPYLWHVIFKNKYNFLLLFGEFFFIVISKIRIHNYTSFLIRNYKIISILKYFFVKYILLSVDTKKNYV